MSEIQTLYEPRIGRAARAMVADSAVLRKLLASDIDATTLERFLIEYCSLGVQITEPVEGWITRAGQRCIELRLADVGAALVDHATHESDHHLMFIEDTERLVARWNARHREILDARALIARGPARAMSRYIELHEDTIASALPFGQVAIELEIEGLSVTLLPALLAQFRRVLGPEVVDALSFLGSHAALDVGHTHLNTRMMGRLLAHHPEAAGDLARIGTEAMFIYLAFFEECWDAASEACAHSPSAETSP